MTLRDGRNYVIPVNLITQTIAEWILDHIADVK